VSEIFTRFPPANADLEDLCTAWLDAAEETRVAYRAWCDADRESAADAYAVFVAASDREAAAADCAMRAAREEQS
jgi:hypothetical protein